MMAYNDAPIEAVGMSPYHANNGGDMRRIPYLEYTKNPAATETAEDLVTLQKQLGMDLRRIRLYTKQIADKHRKEVQFKEGSNVYLNTKHIEFRKTRKLDHLRLGPFKVLERIGDTAYKLSLPKGAEIYPVFYVNLLKQTPSGIPLLKKWPTRPLKKQEWEVDEIIEEQDGLYKVRWKGYTEEDDTWEPLENLHNAKRKVEEFRGRS